MGRRCERRCVATERAATTAGAPARQGLARWRRSIGGFAHVRETAVKPATELVRVELLVGASPAGNHHARTRPRPPAPLHRSVSRAPAPARSLPVVNAAILTLDDAVATASTGDIWLFRGRSVADVAIRTVTNSPVNHVGMVVAIDDLPPLLWHAELGRSLEDVWTGERQRGVQLHLLGDAVRTWNERYRQRAWVRQLEGTIERHHEDRLMETIERFDGRRFPTIPGLRHGRPGGIAARVDVIFEMDTCAQLVPRPTTDRSAAETAAGGSARPVGSRRTPGRRSLSATGAVAVSILIRFAPASLTAQQYDETIRRLERPALAPGGVDYNVGSARRQPPGERDQGLTGTSGRGRAPHFGALWWGLLRRAGAAGDSQHHQALTWRSPHGHLTEAATISSTRIGGGPARSTCALRRPTTPTGLARWFRGRPPVTSVTASSTTWARTSSPKTTSRSGAGPGASSWTTTSVCAMKRRPSTHRSVSTPATRSSASTTTSARSVSRDPGGARHGYRLAPAAGQHAQ